MPARCTLLWLSSTPERSSESDACAACCLLSGFVTRDQRCSAYQPQLRGVCRAAEPAVSLCARGRQNAGVRTGGGVADAGARQKLGVGRDREGPCVRCDVLAAYERYSGGT